MLGPDLVIGKNAQGEHLRNMKPITSLLSICLAALTIPVFADQIVLKNGDRVTGTIVKKADDALTVKSTHFGLITVPWKEIESIKTDAPLNVVLADGKEVMGTLATANGKVDIAGDSGKQSVVPADVKALRDKGEQAEYERMLHPGWKNLWAGTASLGFAGATGNARTSVFTIGMNAARVTRTDKTAIYFNTIKSSATANGRSVDTAQAVRGGVAYNRNLRKRLFVNVFNDYEYDRFQSLDLRVVMGGGLGYSVWKREKSQLDVLGGISWNHETFDPFPLKKFTRNSAEAYWGDDFAYKLSGRSAFTQNFRMFNNLSNTGQYRMNGDIGLTTKLFSWLSWNLALSDRYLSNPSAGRKTNDFLYTTGVGITFASK